MTNIDAFCRFVASYLASDLGRDTPDSVAAALLRLDPEICGFSRRPNVARLHRWRLLTEEVHASREDADLDMTGVFRVGGPARKAV